MIKKMMSYVLGIMLCAMCFVAILNTSTKVYAESITDPIVVELTTTKTTNTVQIKANVIKNTGLYGLQLNLNVDRTQFSVSASGNNMSSLLYTGDSSTGIYMWSPNGTAQNVTTTGTILTLTLTLKNQAKDGTFFVRFSPIACYNDGKNVLDKQTAIQSAKITVENGKVAGTETFEETAGLPAWAIALIAIGGVAVVGGIVTWIVLSKKKQPKSWKKVN